jgi:tetratricopeptide (TPR) repeat protein
VIVAVVGLAACWALQPWASPSPETIWEQAHADFQNGRFDRVDAALARLGRLREPTPLDWYLRALLAMARKQTDQALAALARVPDDHYMAAQARLQAGQSELRRDRVREAEKWLRTALKLDPQLVQAHRELIYIYGFQLRRAELAAEFTALAKLTELTFDNAFHWCLLRNNSWEPRTAVGALSRFLEADPADQWSRMALAENYRRMGRPEEAETLLAVLPRTEPEVIELLARIALDRQDIEEAERLLAAGPNDDPLLARLRGRLALARRDVNSALDYLRIAYAADPLNRETLFGLAAALELSGNPRAAEPLRRAAGNLDRLNSLVQRAGTPDARRDTELMRQLGAACAALDLKPEARAWYKLAIRSNPLDSAAQQALYLLADPQERTPPEPAAAREG